MTRQARERDQRLAGAAKVLALAEHLGSLLTVATDPQRHDILEAVNELLEAARALVRVGGRS